MSGEVILRYPNQAFHRNYDAQRFRQAEMPAGSRVFVITLNQTEVLYELPKNRASGYNPFALS